jgi:hypothetical protein
MKTIGIDIKHSVFDDETEAIMFVTKDIYSESFIIAIPVITFSWEVRDQRDLDDLLKFNVFGDRDKKERLVNVINEAITRLNK